MDSFDVIDAIGMYLIAAILLVAVLLFVHHWRIAIRDLREGHDERPDDSEAGGERNVLLPLRRHRGVIRGAAGRTDCACEEPDGCRHLVRRCLPRHESEGGA